MKMRVLKCPECRANLEIKEDRQFCFCEYCGCKIIFEEEKQEININKNINITKNSSHTERYINEAEVIKARSKEKDSKIGVIIAVLVISIVAVYFVWMGSWFDAEEQKSIAEEQRLQAIVEEIMTDIDNGDYDEAYVKANSLYYTEGWSSEIEDKWDNTRKALVEKIKEAENEKQEESSFWDFFK